MSFPKSITMSSYFQCLFFFFLCFFLFLEVQLIYNIVLVSGVQQSDSVKHMCVFFRLFVFVLCVLFCVILCVFVLCVLFSVIGYYKILNTVSPSMQQIFVVYLVYISCASVNPILPIYPSPLPLLWEKAMAPHSSTLAWKIPQMEEPGRLQSMGSLRVRHD